MTQPPARCDPPVGESVLLVKKFILPITHSGASWPRQGRTVRERDARAETGCAILDGTAACAIALAGMDAALQDPPARAERPDLHRQRENGSSSYIWHVFDRLEDLWPILRE